MFDYWQLVIALFNYFFMVLTHTKSKSSTNFTFSALFRNFLHRNCFVESFLLFSGDAQCTDLSLELDEDGKGDRCFLAVFTFRQELFLFLSSFTLSSDDDSKAVALSLCLSRSNTSLVVFLQGFFEMCY